MTRTMIKKLLATTAIVAVTTMPVMAESTMSKNQAELEQTQSAMYEDGRNTIKVSNLMGRTVYAPEGSIEESAFENPVSDAPDNWEDVADVEDILIDKDGKITAIVIDAGGFLGMNEKRVRVDMDDLKFVTDADNENAYFVVYTGDREMLKSSETDDEAAARDGEWSTKTTYAEDIRTSRDRESFAAADVTTLTAEDLEDARVYGSNNEWVGEIETLEIGENGKITQVIIDVGGFLGIGEKPVAMAFEDLDIRRDEGWGEYTVYVNATEEELESMESWDGQS